MLFFMKVECGMKITNYKRKLTVKFVILYEDNLDFSPPIYLERS